jgi:hypothetical protein
MITDLLKRVGLMPREAPRKRGRARAVPIGEYATDEEFDYEPFMSPVSGSSYQYRFLK